MFSSLLIGSPLICRIHSSAHGVSLYPVSELPSPQEQQGSNLKEKKNNKHFQHCPRLRMSNHHNHLLVHDLVSQKVK